MRMALKHILLDQRRLQRELSALRNAHIPNTIRETRSGPYADAEPRVSVLITVYNYAHAVGRAIESVAANSYDGGFELVIVDDASTDHSVTAVQNALAQVPWLPAKHLVRRRNAGLAAGRNLAADHARGEFLFVLDADNTLYPHAIERLAAALAADRRAAVAYGILEQVSGDGEPLGLMSYLGWDPLRLRFGNYIDAMAMLRKDALLAAGGYTSDARLYGWEDFALWCAFAHRGFHGVRVPEIVARYVSAAHSMITLTNLDGSEAYAALGNAFPFMTGRPLALT
jgi:glycosyltransferase involved in cell wall biosynthesis